jgi:hypothetical protein
VGQGPAHPVRRPRRRVHCSRSARGISRRPTRSCAGVHRGGGGARDRRPGRGVARWSPCSTAAARPRSRRPLHVAARCKYVPGAIGRRWARSGCRGAPTSRWRRRPPRSVHALTQVAAAQWCHARITACTCRDGSAAGGARPRAVLPLRRVDGPRAGFIARRFKNASSEDIRRRARSSARTRAS